MSDSTLEALQPFIDAGVLEPLDVRFGLTMARLAGASDDPLIALGAAMACRSPRLGHVYVDLADIGAVRVEPATGARDQELPWPDPGSWSEAMSGSPLVAGPPPRPLVLDGSRLYLHRYWDYQARLGAELRHRAFDRREVDAEWLSAALAALFPASPNGPGPDLQRVAAAVAVSRGLAVISGGPGTGKTTTVVRLLALLIDQARRDGRELRVALAAPTGKAAARLSESIRLGKRSEALRVLPDEVIERIPEKASTLHRLLGFQTHRPTRFRHDAETPLPFDVVVVDEASMIPLSLMSKLLDAVPSDARLVLLGDRDQLASVEAGTVLGDICPLPESAPFGDELAAQLAGLGADLPRELASPGSRSGGRVLRDSIVHLEHSYRFDTSGGIGKLAAEVKAGRSETALDLLREAGNSAAADGRLALVESDDPRLLATRLQRIVLGLYIPLPTDASEMAALESVQRFCVLCAHRRGPLGAVQLNEDIARWLTAAGRIDACGEWYAGRPIIVTQNDYQLGLFNGDIGITLPAKDGRGGLRVVFPTGEEPHYRELAPGRLPPHETVFAMTVHKSQGSEFDRVVLVLPPHPSRVLTRELLYTGITRAREHVTVVGPARVIASGIRERVQRASGLREILWPVDDR